MTVRVAEHFHPIRMTCPIQPKPYFLATPKFEESPPISLSLRNPQRERMSIHLFPNSSSLINHYEESHLVYGSLWSILLDQRVLVKKQIRWYTRTTFYILSLLRDLAAYQCKPLYFMLPLKPSFKNLTMSWFFSTTFIFHQHLARG